MQPMSKLWPSAILEEMPRFAISTTVVGSGPKAHGITGNFTAAFGRGVSIASATCSEGVIQYWAPRAR